MDLFEWYAIKYMILHYHCVTCILNMKVEERGNTAGGETPTKVTLVTLREGHCFGEMSLVSNEPRLEAARSYMFI